MKVRDPPISKNFTMNPFPDDAREMFLKATNLGDNPILDARDPDLPVGLKVNTLESLRCHSPITVFII